MKGEQHRPERETASRPAPRSPPRSLVEFWKARRWERGHPADSSGRTSSQSPPARPSHGWTRGRCDVDACIRSVEVVSTGMVDIRPQHVRNTGTPAIWWLMTSRKWTDPRPINVYVIEHRDGLVLFDTGQDRASVTDPGYFPGGITGVIYDRLARFEIAPEQTLTAQLAAIGYDIRDVRTAVISHLHQDHIGGLRELTGAEIIVSRDEWETLRQPLPEMKGLLRSHIEIPGLR